MTWTEEEFNQLGAILDKCKPMKYPKEYRIKAREFIDEYFFPDEESEVNNTEMITLAAELLSLVSFHMAEISEHTYEDCFKSIIRELTPIQKNEND